MDFDYELHVFRSPELGSIVKTAVEFFSKTPVHYLPPPHDFSGPGVYGLYYIGDYEPYASIADLNGIEYQKPIYIGKAVAPGSRTARIQGGISSTLLGRLQEHAASIGVTTNLKVEDFRCRFMVLDGIERDLIVPIESELIRAYQPLWNVCVSGFGIHTPGIGRFGQSPSEWDTLHPGRSWVEKLTGKPRDLNEILAKIRQHLASSPP
jgi:hypothetical protein